MNKVKINSASIAVFLLLYYIYMNSIRKLMIPFSKIIVPAILFFSLAIFIVKSNGMIYIGKKSEKVQLFSWVIISTYVLINNSNLLDNFLNGGLIQFYVLISIMVFVLNEDEWIKDWINLSQVFVLIHALATIYFLFNSNAYLSFVRYFFTGQTLSDLLRFYNKGWMSGLCTHFSSNGMILAIGLIMYWEKILYYKKDKENNRKNLILNYIGILLVLYALILSSKRGPLISAFIAIAITFIFAQGKNVGKRIFIFLLGCLGIYVAYNMLLQSIPGLATIMNKMNALEESDVGVLNGRLGKWEAALEMIKIKPVVGHGYGSYAIYTASLGRQTSAHNYYLSVLAELGIIGLLLYIFAFVSGILSGFSIMRSEADNKCHFNVMVTNISVEIQLFVIFYSLTATSMMYYHIMIPYFLACAALRTISKKSEILS